MATKAFDYTYSDSKGNRHKSAAYGKTYESAKANMKRNHPKHKNVRMSKKGRKLGYAF